MSHYDVFNGDADGICALIQLRLAQPIKSELVTGVKRDIALLGQVPTTGSAAVTVLDISLDKNRAALDALLAAGSSVQYFDHHFPGETLPEHVGFSGTIDTDPVTCTSLLVDQYLQGAFRNWAITAAFGDNLNGVAEQLGASSGLTEDQLEQLKILGICINYNAYGATTEDLHFHPAELYQYLVHYNDPLDYMAEDDSWLKLKRGYESDMAKASAIEPLVDKTNQRVVMLPDVSWARRVNGVLGNELANQNPAQGIAILTAVDDEHYAISVRAPLANRSGADELVRRFPTGGGRKAAAGINRLPIGQLDDFIAAMGQQWA